MVHDDEVVIYLLPTFVNHTVVPAGDSFANNADAVITDSTCTPQLAGLAATVEAKPVRLVQPDGAQQQCGQISAFPSMVQDLNPNQTEPETVETTHALKPGTSGPPGVSTAG